MLYTFVLTGVIPSKKNSKIVNKTTGRIFPSKSFVKWHKAAMKEICPQLNSSWPITKARTVRIGLTFGTKRRADLTNKAESIMDLLVDKGILLDDSWQVVPELVLTGSYSHKADGAFISIEVDDD